MVKLALLGHDIHYSLSPLIYETIGKQLNTQVSYEIFDSRYVDYASLIKRLKTEEYNGFNVTIPYKKEILKLCEAKTDLAKRVGASNTVLCKDKLFYAENTDVYGIREAFQACGIEVANKKILLLGAGGVARAAVVALSDLGAKEIVIWNRTESRALELIEDLQTHIPNCRLTIAEKTWFFIDMSVKFDGLIHAMPYFEQKYDVGGGIGGFETDISGHVTSEGFIYDVVYRPLKNPLSEISEEHKLKYENGLTMLVHQALKSWDFWTQQNVAKNVSLFESVYQVVHKALESEGLKA